MIRKTRVLVSSCLEKNENNAIITSMRLFGKPVQKWRNRLKYSLHRNFSNYNSNLYLKESKSMPREITCGWTLPPMYTLTYSLSLVHSCVGLHHLEGSAIRQFFHCLTLPDEFLTSYSHAEDE
jgi:hypothetical protein